MNNIFNFKKAAFSCLFFVLFNISCTKSDRSVKWIPLDYFDSGSVKSMALYFSAKEDSSMLIREYYDNGNLRSLYQFENGKLSGPAIGYYPNGCVAMSNHFEHGKKNMHELTYHENGMLKSNFVFNDGLCVSGNYFYDNGQPTGNLVFDSLGFIKSGVYFHENGRIRSKGGFYPPNVKDGIWEYYYSNGQLKEKGEYVEGKKRKNWLMYDSLGNHTMTVPYH